ncbi:hypothetical protein CYMTET_6853 [Cymbomonas tetramitiformis]|uniref:Glutathione transferase n=1 Tax=Cymbomonas tetramitiformis TaxID=36881 RepID=A0AAE0LHL6_9CHLO|nr:hypothetical protein CYMTET_6853 [Cymbomonas tetramitiformis]|eukprot:gene25848-31630_t
MPVLDPDGVVTKEVLQWKGFHLFYADFSVCSRKVMLVCALKGINFTPHKLELSRSENRSPYYVGINPRGLVPCLVHDGNVVIESNDILYYIEERYKEPVLLKDEELVTKLLQVQDSYHMDIRTITMRFVLPICVTSYLARSTIEKMNEEDKHVVDVAGGGQGRKVQRDFYQSMLDNNGIPDESVVASVNNLLTALKPIEDTYGHNDFLVGDSLTLADVAFWCDIERLFHCGFPVEEKFPNLFRAFHRLLDTLPPSAKHQPGRGPLLTYNRFIAWPIRFLLGTNLVDYIKHMDEQKHKHGSTHAYSTFD